MKPTALMIAPLLLLSINASGAPPRDAGPLRSALQSAANNALDLGSPQIEGLLVSSILHPDVDVMQIRAAVLRATDNRGNFQQLQINAVLFGAAMNPGMDILKIKAAVKSATENYGSLKDLQIKAFLIGAAVNPDGDLIQIKDAVKAATDNARDLKGISFKALLIGAAIFPDANLTKLRVAAFGYAYAPGMSRFELEAFVLAGTLKEALRQKQELATNKLAQASIDATRSYDAEELIRRKLPSEIGTDIQSINWVSQSSNEKMFMVHTADGRAISVSLERHSNSTGKEYFEFNDKYPALRSASNVSITCENSLKTKNTLKGRL